MGSTTKHNVRCDARNNELKKLNSNNPYYNVNMGYSIKNIKKTGFCYNNISNNKYIHCVIIHNNILYDSINMFINKNNLKYYYMICSNIPTYTNVPLNPKGNDIDLNSKRNRGKNCNYNHIDTKRHKFELKTSHKNMNVLKKNGNKP